MERGTSEPARGFTLIELLVVLIIIGILAGIAVVNFRRMQAESNLESSAQRLLLDIRRAKTAANRSGDRHFVSFASGSRAWTVLRNPGGGSASFATAAAGLVTVSRDSLAPAVSFGPQSGSLPAIGALSAPSSSAGFGPVTAPANDDCNDGAPYPTTQTGSGWALASGGGLVVACGGPTGDLNHGVLYLSARRTDKAYAIGYNDDAQIQVRLFRFDGSNWEEVQ